MPKGRNGRKKDKESRRRVECDIQDKGQLETDVNVRECPQPVGHQSQENLTTLLKNEEVLELRNILKTQELNEVPLLVGAVAIGKFNLVRKLVDEDHPINCYGPGNMTPLMWAVQNKALEMIGLLLMKDADVTLLDDQGDNALMIALQDPTWNEESFLGFWNMVKDCENLDLNHANISGSRVIHYAVKKQWMFFIDSLLAMNVEVNCATNHGETPLILAATHNHFNLVRPLLRAGAQFSREDECGCTALCYAFAGVIQKGRHNSSLLQRLLGRVDAESVGYNLMRDYMQRRLELLIHPPKDSVLFVKAMTHVTTNVLSFFVRCFVAGIELLLDLHVFARVSEATQHHLEDSKYCHALMGIMFELVRHCSCCIGATGQADEVTEQLRNAFVEEGGANACLSVLKKHCDPTCTKETEITLVAAIFPLLSVCGDTICENTFCQWLEEHYQEIKPFYKAFSSMKLITVNLNTDRSHIRDINGKIKSFKKVMISLGEKRGCESFAEKKQPCNDQAFPRLNKTLNEDDDISCPKKSRRQSAKTKKLLPEQTTQKSMREASPIEYEAKILESSDCVTTEEQNINDAIQVSMQIQLLNGLNNSRFAEGSDNCHLQIQLEEEPKEHAAILQPEYEVPENRSELNCVESVHFAENYKLTHSVSPDLDRICRPTSEQKMQADQGQCNRVLSNALETHFQLFDDAVSKKVLHYTAGTYSNPDREKGLTGAVYVQNVFKEVRDTLLELWHWEQANDFPGHLIVSTQPSGEDTTLRILTQILPELEHSYLQNLGNRWQSLTKKLRLSERDSFHRIIGRLDILLQCYLLDFETTLNNGNSADDRVVNHPMRKRRSDISFKEEYEICKKARISQYENLITKKLSDWLINYGKLSGNEETSKCVVDQNGEKSENESFNRKAAQSFFPTFNGALNRSKKANPSRNICENNSTAGGCNKMKCNSRVVLETSSRKSNRIPRIITRDFRKLPFSSFKSNAFRWRNARNKTYNVKTIDTSSMCEEQGEACFSSPLPDFFKNKAESICPQENTLYAGSDGLSAYKMNLGSQCIGGPSVATSENDDTSQRVIKVPKRHRHGLGNGGCFGHLANALSHAPDVKDNPIAIKSIYVENSYMTEDVKGTLNVMRNLRHTNIAHVIAYHQRGNILLLCNARCQNNLADHVKMLTAMGMIGDRSKNLISQMVTGLCFLHKLKTPIIHANLKPTNILIDSSGVVKLADFGLDNMLHRRECPLPFKQIWWSCDTHVNYGQFTQLFFTHKSDVQTLGMLLYFVETGGLHPYGTNSVDVVDNVIHGRVLISARVNHELEHLVMSMLTHDPAKRPAIVTAAKHLYFWDVAKKWSYVLACAGIASPTRCFTLSSMDDLHAHLDERLMLNMDLWCWISTVNGRFPMMHPIGSHFSNSPSGLLRFIRACVECKHTSSPFNFSLRDFFLTTFTTLPLILYQIIDNTNWLRHQAFLLNENFK